MKRALIFIFLLAGIAGAQSFPQLSTQRINFNLQNPPAPVTQGTVAIVGGTGNSTYYVWIVAKFAIGNAQVSPALVATYAPGQLTASRYLQVNWFGVVGATGYDVLLTTSASQPSGQCNCLSQTVTAATAQVTSNTTSSYTVNPYAGNSTFVITNPAVGAGESQLTFAADHGTQMTIDNVNGVGVQSLTATSPAITPTSIGPIYQVDQFTGADMGAKINACYAKLAALTTPGGTCDARLLTGAQSASATITVGSSTTPMTLLLGAVTLTSSASPAVTVKGVSGIVGLGSGTGGSVIVGAPSSTVVDWSANHGGIDGVSIQPGSGTSNGLVIAASATSGQVWYNGFRGIQVYCTDASGDAIQLAAYDATDLVSFNDFYNPDVVNCANSVHFETASGGNVPPTDNHFYGGEYRKTATGGTGFLFTTGADNALYSPDIAGDAQGAEYLSGADGNFQYAPIYESNTSDILTDAGSGDNAFYGVSGNITDNGSGTWFTGSNNSSGAAGSVLSKFGSPISTFSLLDSTGQTTALTGSATGGTTSTLPGVTAVLVPYLDSCFLGGSGTPCVYATYHANSGLNAGAVVSAPDSSFGPGLAVVQDTAQRGIIVYSQDVWTSTSTWASLELNTSGLSMFANARGVNAVLPLSPTGGGINIGGGQTITSSNNIALTSALPYSGSVAGSTTLLAANTCGDAVTTTVTGATTSMVPVVSPSADPGVGLTWQAFVSAADTVTVRYCNATAAGITPAAATLQIRVVQ